MTLRYIRNQVEPGGITRKTGVTCYAIYNVFVNRRVNNSGTNRINGYPRFGELFRKALRKTNDGEFRTAGRGYIWEALLAADRRHIDYPTIRSGNHARKNRTGGEEMSFEVDIENAVPFLFGHLKKRRIAAGTGIVD